MKNLAYRIAVWASGIALAIALAIGPVLADTPVHVQTPVINSSSGVPITSYWDVSAANPFPVTLAGASASSGSGNSAYITPNGTTAPLAVTTISGNVALPGGSAVQVFNNGAVVAYVTFGTSNAVTTTTGNGIPIPPNGGFINVIVGSNTYLAGITASGTTTLLLSGGSIPGFTSIYSLNNGSAAPANSALSGCVYEAVQPSIGTNGGLYGVTCDGGQRVNVNDFQSAPFSGAIAMTVGTIYTAQRTLGVNCTIAGNVSVTFSDASTIVVPVAVGWQTFTFAVTEVNSSGTTATATYYNLK